MVVQPRTAIIISVISVIVILSGSAYLIFFRDNNEIDPSAVTEAELLQTPLFDLARLANIVRSAYDQKLSDDDNNKSNDDDSDDMSKIICGDLLKDVDLSLMAQTLSVDIEQKINEVVVAQQVAANTWENCAATCTCSILSNLLEKALEVGERIDPKNLEAAQAGAESLTTPEALKCAEMSKDFCASPLARKYAEQAATIE